MPKENGIRPPKHLGLEITSRCQAQCIGCPQPVMDRRGKDMPYDLALKIIHEAAAMGIETLLPHHFGEPTLAPRFPDIVRVAKRIGLRVRLYTNASMLHKPEVRSALLDHVDDLVFSVDGATAESMSRARPGLNAERIFDAVRGYLAEPNRQRVTVRMTSFDFSEGEEQDFKRRWKEAGAEVVAVVRDLRTASIRDHVLPCSQPFDHMSVLVDGRVALCCRDFHATQIMGSAETQSLESVWTGIQISRVRSLHLEGRSAEIDLCATCTRKTGWDPKAGKVVVPK